MAGGISIDASSLDPILLQLGTVSGLLTASNGSVALNTDFFEDPIGHLEQIPAARADQLAGLLAQLLGSATDGALGLPGAGANRQWIKSLFFLSDTFRVEEQCRGRIVS
jgi:hypothetical protein